MCDELMSRTSTSDRAAAAAVVVAGFISRLFRDIGKLARLLWRLINELDASRSDVDSHFTVDDVNRLPRQRQSFAATELGGPRFCFLDISFFSLRYSL